MPREPAPLGLVGTAAVLCTPGSLDSRPAPLAPAPAGGLGVLETAAATELWSRSPEATPFQHPAWLRAWWGVFVAGTGARTFVWEARDPATDRLEVLAAWTVRERPLWLGRPMKRLQLLGQDSWLADAFPSEYAALLVEQATLPRVEELHVRSLDATLDLDWDDLRLDYVIRGSAFSRALQSWLRRHRLPHLVVGHDRAYAVDTTGDARAYWAGRSANTRRALRTKRRTAERRGIRYEPGDGVDGATLETLCRLHDVRWGAAGMPARGREFLRRLAATPSRELALRTSLLRADGVPVSASLNLDCRRAVYNLQGGFVPDWDPRLSLGKLHVGYEIDGCFAGGLRCFDMLVGRGMKSDYKAAIATCATPVASVWIARSARARLLLAMRGARRRVVEAAATVRGVRRGARWP